jgi:predicted acetyltransferase
VAENVAVTLRLPSREDESAVAAAQAELAADDFEFVFQDPDEPWAAYVDRVEKQSRGVDVRPDQVAAALLLAEVGGEIVGRVSIRHELNDYLERFGGHIGYAVRPAFRGRGYATSILGESLRVAHARGLTRVLLICDDANTASRRPIEACEGVLERVDTAGEAAPTCRYWIDLTEPIR